MSVSLTRCYSDWNRVANEVEGHWRLVADRDAAPPKFRRFYDSGIQQGLDEMRRGLRVNPLVFVADFYLSTVYMNRDVLRSDEARRLNGLAEQVNGLARQDAPLDMPALTALLSQGLDLTRPFRT